MGDPMSWMTGKLPNENVRAPAETSLKAGRGPVDDVPMETMFDILRNRRRRLVLHYLVEIPGHGTVLGTLATQIAAWENEVPVSAIDSRLRKRTYNALQQTHLPKLDDAGLVEYDRDRGTIDLAVRPRQLEMYLSVLPKMQGTRTYVFLLSGFVLWFALALIWFSTHVLGVYQDQSGLLAGVVLLLAGVGILSALRAVL